MARRRSIRRENVPPVEAVEGGWRLNIDTDERELLVRLMGEFETLLTGPDDNPLLARLFPVAYEDDPDKEAEYQRLMREELVASRLESMMTVTSVLDPDDAETLDEGQTIAFMQSINAVRLVLGTMLGIENDDDDPATTDGGSAGSESPEYHLYNFLSWLLEWTVRALSGT
jgi:hypothetical protein